MNKSIFIILIFFLISSNFLFSQTNFDKFRFYKEKYRADCVDEKITDNFGNGFDSLYGTRNMRTILFGVAYRGGANNFYNKFNKKDNHNPMPDDGLQNLCNQGFSSAVYLYSTNFADSKRIYINQKTKDTLKYMQNSGMSRKTLKELMFKVYEVIQNPKSGPIYLHCWNGWHQSGFVSAAILMQFCKYSNDQAYQYWIDNTDGVNKGYDNVKNLVKNFKIFEDISIDGSIRKEICPCMKK
jgi:hypothetical protein